MCTPFLQKTAMNTTTVRYGGHVVRIAKGPLEDEHAAADRAWYLARRFEALGWDRAAIDPQWDALVSESFRYVYEKHQKMGFEQQAAAAADTI